MTYNPDIPNNFPPPNVAVDKIRTNFSQYAQVFDNNHAALNSSHQGKHTHVIMQQQSDDPEVEGSFDSLYGKSVTSTLNTSDQVFVKIPEFLPNNQPNTPMQLTFNSVNTTGPSQYQSFLAGGYIIYFGTTSNIAVPITLVPAPSIILCVIPNPTAFTNVGTPIPIDISVTILNLFQFKLNSVAGPGSTFTWVAIAKQ